VTTTLESRRYASAPERLGPSRARPTHALAPLRWLGVALSAGLATAGLAAPAEAATFTVTNLNDAGPGSLRQAIIDASQPTNPGSDVITFANNLAGGAIHLQGALSIFTSVSINGDLDNDGEPDITLDQDKADERVVIVPHGPEGPPVITLRGLVITGGNLSGNKEGGGIYNWGTLTVTHTSITGNTAGIGGGISNFGSLAVANSTIANNTAQDGGGIGNAGSLSVTNSIIRDNTSVYGGGISIHHVDTALTKVTNSTIADNTVSREGGGIYSGTGPLTVSNSTITGNSASRGGGINTWSTLTVTNSTITTNTSTDSMGGGIRAASGSTYVAGSIVAGNSGGDCTKVPSYAWLVSSGSNLESGTSCGFAAANDQQNIPVGDLFVTDAAGAPVPTNNGGPTPTIALRESATNPAVDRIPAPCGMSNDQRGIDRPQGNGCDIGAYELVKRQPHLTISGFFAPVDMNGVWNTVKAGSAVPLKFRIYDGEDEITEVSAVDGFTIEPVACDATETTAWLESLATEGTALRYADSQFIRNWKTPKTPGCYAVTVSTTDGASITANFLLK